MNLLDEERSRFTGGLSRVEFLDHYIQDPKTFLARSFQIQEKRRVKNQIIRILDPFCLEIIVLQLLFEIMARLIHHVRVIELSLLLFIQLIIPLLGYSFLFSVDPGLELLVQ